MLKLAGERITKAKAQEAACADDAAGGDGDAARSLKLADEAAERDGKGTDGSDRRSAAGSSSEARSSPLARLLCGVL